MFSQKGVVLLVLVLILLLSNISLAENNEQLTTGCIYYFYGDNCAGCAKADTALEQAKALFPKVDFYRFESYYDRANTAKLNQLFESYGIPQDSQGLPALFIGKSYLIGADPINELLVGRIKDNKDSACPDTSVTKTAVGVVGVKISSNVLRVLSLFQVAGAGFMNGLNLVFILALLVILSTYVMTKKKVLLAGLAFIGGVGLMYLFYGLGSIEISASTVFSNFMDKFFAVAAVIFSIKGIREFITAQSNRFHPEEKEETNKDKDIFKNRKKEKIENDKFRYLFFFTFLLLGMALAFLTFSRSSEVFVLLSQTAGEKDLFAGSFFFIMVYTLFLATPLAALVLAHHLIIMKIEDQLKGYGTDKVKIKRMNHFYQMTFRLLLSLLIIVISFYLFF